jgi:hypothetical protein
MGWGARRVVPNTRYPRCARRNAHARPIPEDAPVINSTPSVRALFRLPGRWAFAVILWHLFMMVFSFAKGHVEQRLALCVNRFARPWRIHSADSEGGPAKKMVGTEQNHRLMSSFLPSRTLA